MLTDTIPRELTRQILDALESDADVSLRCQVFDALRDIAFPMIPATTTPTPTAVHHPDQLRALAAELREQVEIYRNRDDFWTLSGIEEIADKFSALAEQT